MTVEDKGLRSCALPLERRVRQPIVLATVHFALMTARVRVLETVVTVNQRLWRVEDCMTGRQDVVGDEYLTDIVVAFGADSIPRRVDGGREIEGG